MGLSELDSHEAVSREHDVADPANSAEQDRLELTGVVSVVVARHRTEEDE